ncbi:MAG: UxaA family hydrolase [Dehalococcoidales bacterium]|nr:UxaA family hydrolase [Dehalococcoidales bacterium]
MPEITFQGYRRPNGEVGTRNHVVILTLDDLSTAVAEGVAALVPGAIALPHPYGRLQFGADLDLHFRALIGTGCNPNVAACLVVGIEPVWTNRIVEGIASTGKPVEGYTIEGHDDIATIARAARRARELVQWASALWRQPAEAADLFVSLKCGESDTTSGLASNPALGAAAAELLAAGAAAVFGEQTELTGAEQVMAERFRTPEMAQRFLRGHEDYVRLLERHGVSLLGSQPTQGNVAGGLTTIEEKALGAVQKIGKAPIEGLLGEAEPPSRRGGLWFMEGSTAGAEALTLWSAAGVTLHLFATGQGNVIGNAVSPVLKICANPKTVQAMVEHVDVDISGLLRREYDLAEAGRRILDATLATASGRLTCAETLGHREFVISKLFRSA